MRPTRHGQDSRKYYDWMETAARDLLTARLLLEQEQCLDIAGFHCQQGMEKAFKAYIIKQTEILVDGHNLTWLCRQASKHNLDFRKWLESTAAMNRLYIETRYPSDIELNLTDDKLKKIYDIAQDLYDFVCGEIYDDIPYEGD